MSSVEETTMIRDLSLIIKIKIKACLLVLFCFCPFHLLSTGCRWNQNMKSIYCFLPYIRQLSLAVHARQNFPCTIMKTAVRQD